MVDSSLSNHVLNRNHQLQRTANVLLLAPTMVNHTPWCRGLPSQMTNQHVSCTTTIPCSATTTPPPSCGPCTIPLLQKVGKRCISWWILPVLMLIFNRNLTENNSYLQPPVQRASSEPLSRRANPVLTGNHAAWPASNCFYVLRVIQCSGTTRCQ